MENKLQTQKRNVVKVDDLYTDIEKSIQYNALNQVLNAAPAPKWVKEHPFIKVEALDQAGKKVTVPLKYIPISTVEFLLTAIFLKWRFEIKSVMLIGNSVVTIGRLHVLDPITGDWDWQDGEGAIPLQTDKDAGAIDFNHLKSNAVTLAAPASESEALKDAAHKFGKIFGKDLNRRDEMNYAVLEKKFKERDFEEKKMELSKKLRETNLKMLDVVGIGQIDVETLQGMCAEKEEAGEMTEPFVDNILNALKDGK